MDLRQLRYFVQVVDSRGFTAAAAVLHLAQPALGMQIKKLEVELGAQLLVRHSRGAEPTSAGLVLYADARDILARVDGARRRVREDGGAPAGRLTVGLTPSAGFMLATRLVRRCRDAAPEVALNLVEDLSETLLAWTAQDGLDMSVAYGEGPARGVALEPLAEERLYYICDPQSALAGATHVTLADIAARPLIVPGAPHGLRRLLEVKAVEIGARLQVTYEMRAVSAARELVAEGVASTVLPLGAVRREVEQGRLRALPIESPELTRTLHLVTPLHRPTTRAEALVRHLLRELAAEDAADERSGWRPPLSP